jgi:acyl-CoA-dependent ceramide synthase
MWLIMIIKVVIRVLRGEGADDSRSDAEDEDEEELDELEQENPVQPSAPFTLNEPQQRFIEVEADSTELSHSYIRRSGSGSKSRPKSKGAGGFSSGLNFGDRKEILNRIGCLSEEQLAREREKKGENSARPGSGGK